MDELQSIRDAINRQREAIRTAREQANRVKTYENTSNLQRLERDHKAMYPPLRLVSSNDE